MHVHMQLEVVTITILLRSFFEVMLNCITNGFKQMGKKEPLTFNPLRIGMCTEYPFVNSASNLIFRRRSLRDGWYNRECSFL